MRSVQYVHDGSSQERAADLYRTKGLLSFHGQGDTKFVFQGVHEQIIFGSADSPWCFHWKGLG